MAQPTRPGNAERGWNDPPMLLTSASTPGVAQLQKVSMPRKSLLTKRVAHPGIFGGGGGSAPQPASQPPVAPPVGCGGDGTGVPANSLAEPPSAETGGENGLSVPQPVSIGAAPSLMVDNLSKSPVAGVVLLPPSDPTDVPRFAAPIIVPGMIQSEGATVPGQTNIATNPVTNTQVNTQSEDDDLGIPNFQDDEQMLNFVITRLQRVCSDCQASVQSRVLEDIAKKLDIFASMWHRGKISYPVKSSMARLATALHKRRCDLAHRIHLALMIDYVSEVGQWMVGIKRLIQEAREVDPPLSPTYTTVKHVLDTNSTQGSSSTPPTHEHSAGDHGNSSENTQSELSQFINSRPSESPDGCSVPAEASEEKTDLVIKDQSEQESTVAAGQPSHDAATKMDDDSPAVITPTPLP